MSAATPVLQARILFGPSLRGLRTMALIERTAASPSEGDAALASRLERLLADLGVAAPAASPTSAPALLALAAQMATLISDRIGFPSTEVQVVETPDGVVIEGRDVFVLGLVAELAIALVAAAAAGAQRASQDLKQRWAQTQETLSRTKLTVQIQAIFDGCATLAIPCFRFLADRRFLHLGEGRRRQMLNLSDTATTSALGVKLARDKAVTNRILTANGLPTARQMVVQSVDQAWSAAQAMGLPVVVKPINGNHGNGVNVHVRTREAMGRAIEAARQVSAGVIVETFIPGRDYRVVVANGRLIGCVERLLPQVAGDGQQTVEELVRQSNATKAAPDEIVKPIDPASLDEGLLREQGHSRQSVPKAGEVVLLGRIAGRRFGGRTISVPLSVIHPDNADMLARANAVIELDPSGIDVRFSDIARSWREAGGAICEVNSAAGFFVMLLGDPNWVRDAFLPAVVDPAACSIPHVVVLRPESLAREADAWCDDLGQRLGEHAQWQTGVLHREGLRLGAYETAASGLSLHAAYRRIIECPLVDAGLYAVAPSTIEREGLGIPSADTLVLFGPAERWSADDKRIAGQLAERLSLAPMTVESEALDDAALSALVQRWS
jgi:D-alanine-D-alanine ligase-like ATP-grasp enzyme